MTNPTGFDAADLADSILGLDDPPPPPAEPIEYPAPVRRGALGWVLLVGLVIAVSVAISLAVQLDTTPASGRVTPDCGGLYSECCDQWDDNWGPCEDHCDIESNRPFTDADRDDGRGLFDAEDDFAEHRLPPGC